MKDQYDNDYDEIDLMKNRSNRKRLEAIRRQERIHQKNFPQNMEDDFEDSDDFDTENVQTPVKRRKKKHKFRLIIIELFILAVLVLCAGYYFSRQGDTGYWNIAVFGVDSRDGNLGKGALSDVEMICSINKETGEIKLVSVYRDTYVQINSDGTYHKLNEAYFKGGPDQALYALNTNLDLNIHDYATFNWTAVVNAINILGGVDLEISDSEFAYINSFITETVNATGIGSYQLEHAGMNHLDGVQAVAYSRLRLMDTDYQRTERQRKVVTLAFEKAKKMGPGTLKELVLAIMPQIKTNIGIDNLLPMALKAGKYHLGETSGFPFSKGTTKIGKKDCVIPLTLESNVSELHNFLYPEIAYTPSDALKKINARIISDSGMGDVVEGKPSSQNTGSSNNNKETKKETVSEQTTHVFQESQNESSSITVEENINQSEESSTEEVLSDADNESSESADHETVSENSTEDSKESESEIGPGVADPGEIHPTESYTKPAVVETSKEVGPGIN